MNELSVKGRAAWFITLNVLSILTVQMAWSTPTQDEAIKRAYGKLADSPWLASQSKGDVATGVVVYEKDGKLYLDSDPCNKKFYYFTQPYEKTLIPETAKCGGD